MQRILHRRNKREGWQSGAGRGFPGALVQALVPALLEALQGQNAGEDFHVQSNNGLQVERS